MKRFEGRTAVVTGGAQGIGLATADRLFAEGANVLIADIKEWEGSAASQKLTLGDRVAYCPADVSVAAQVEAMMAAAEARFGAIDVLVSNVGVAKSTPFLNLGEEEIEAGFRINLFSMIWCCQAAMRRMKARGKGGAVVLMSSVNAVMTMPGFTIYNCSKGGIEQLTRVLSIEFADDNIRVNAVGPGTILTELATILERRTKLLVAEGFFADEAEGKAYCADLRALDADPARRDIAFRLGVEPELLETERRVTELRNWIEHQVRPQKSRRGRG